MESNSNKTKRTRIVTKPGFIYQVNVNNEFLSFFQLVCEDHTNCNTDVIRVFKRKYPIGSTPQIEDIISDDILFYTHTIVNAGVYKNYWIKYGKSANIGIEKLDNVWFGTVHDKFMTKSLFWRRR